MPPALPSTRDTHFLLRLPSDLCSVMEFGPQTSSSADSVAVTGATTSNSPLPLSIHPLQSRGSVRDGSGVHDTIVNQLLTKIDGVNALNNILVIGMTNRLELLDEALLREGRLDVHMEIGLPDENGRLQILKVRSRVVGMVNEDIKQGAHTHEIDGGGCALCARKHMGSLSPC